MVAMSQITIQCRLFADETARQYLWELMCDRNTPLVNELLRLIALHPDFLTWRRRGKIPTAEVTNLAKTLKTDPRFSNQPAKFHISAEKTALYTFKSWVAIQKRTQWKLQGKLSWLRMLRTDEESIADCGQDLEQIRNKAQALLLQYQSSEESTESKQNLRRSLYQAYDLTDDALTQSAIAYLLRNSCEIPAEIEEQDPKKFLEYRRKIENQVKRLTQQLENRLPRGRDLTGERFLTTLESATRDIPIDNAEASRWQSQLLKRSDLVPFPIVLEDNKDLMWFLDEQGKIALHIGGLSEHEFTIGCDQRQLHYFKQFLSDYQLISNNKNLYTSSLAVLRSAKLIWVPTDKRGEPWNIYSLHLFCTLDTRRLTAEGTELVKQEVVAENTKQLINMRGKSNRTKNQDGYIKRLQTTLDKLDGSFERPSKPLYRGQSNIIVSVSIGLQSSLIAIVFDVMTQKVLACRSTKQLLGDDYLLFNRQQNLQKQQRRLNHNGQKQGRSRQFSNSALGEHLDRLFAKAIVELAQTCHAGSIALPKLDQINLSIQSAIDAKAQQKIPDCKKGQKKYAKQVRIDLHNWSYSRLNTAILNKAAQSGIEIEYGNQTARASPAEQAKEIALSAYAKRTIS
jgi:hypothetical protein